MKWVFVSKAAAREGPLPGSVLIELFDIGCRAKSQVVSNCGAQLKIELRGSSNDAAHRNRCERDKRVVHQHHVCQTCAKPFGPRSCVRSQSSIISPPLFLHTRQIHCKGRIPSYVAKNFAGSQKLYFNVSNRWGH